MKYISVSERSARGYCAGEKIDGAFLTGLQSKTTKNCPTR